MSLTDPPSNVAALVESRFGVQLDFAIARFAEPGWTFQGACDINCGDCESWEPFVVYRKPYTTPQGSYRYWAIVCLSCKTISDLSDFEAADKRKFRAWESETVTSARGWQKSKV